LHNIAYVYFKDPWYNFGMLNKKSISIILAVFIAVFSLNPEKVEAGVPTFDWAQFSKEFAVDTVVTILQSRVINKLIDDSLSWANNGFDGEPGFINNWDGFLKNTEHGALSSAFVVANRAATVVENSNDSSTRAEFEQCVSSIDLGYSEQLTELSQKLEEGLLTDEEYDLAVLEVERQQTNENYSECQEILETTTDPAQQAANNYNTYQSGELDTARSVAETVARFGGKRLSGTGFEDLVGGSGETLTGLLGGKAEKDNFFRDIGSVGNDGTKGLQAYMAAADPHNYPAGLKTLVENKLETDTVDEVSRNVQNLQTPLKFLDKKVCVKYSEEEVPETEDRKCLEEKTMTPGEIVSSESRQSLGAERDQSYMARELSDVLASALGRLADGLLTVGMSQLTTAASGGGNSAAQVNTPFTSNYQNEFDVLGLNDDATLMVGEGDGSNNGDSGGNIIPSTSEDPFSGDIVDGSAPFVGGPEDVREGQSWNEGPELIINLQEVLEFAIINTEEELSSYQDAERIIKKGQDNIKKIDRCTPGPDYNWERRFDDQLPSGNTNDDREIQRRIGRNEQKSMVNDSLVNIPGAQRMRSIVETSLAAGSDEFDEVNDTRTRKQNILSSLKNIRGLITADFNIYKQSINPKLTLFVQDWDQLTSSEQLELFTLPVLDDNGDPVIESFEDSSGEIVEYPLYLVDKYIIIKHREGETAESVFNDKGIQSRDAVLTVAWDLWRTEKGMEIGNELASPPIPSGGKQKSNIRYRYYILRNQISTQADVLRAELIKDEATQNNETIADFLNDCIQLKSFATGYTPEVIEFTLENPPLKFSFQNLEGSLTNLPMVTLFEKHGREYRALDIQNAKSDTLIRDFIMSEKAKQEDNNDVTVSVFKTNIITGDGSIAQSILGFNSEQEKTDYFDDFYPDENLPDQVITRNAKTIAEIFQKDYTTGTWPRGGGATGTLFCRLGSVFDSIGDRDDQNLTECMQTYYRMSNLEYSAIISGI
jgi:hypothetical protein